MKNTQVKNARVKTTKAIAVAAVFSALAAPAEAARLLILKMSGDRGWSITCTIERDGKEPIARKATGRGDVRTIAVRGVSGGSCSYEAPENGAFQIRFTHEANDSACPFSRVQGHCIGRFSDGAKGSFDF